MVEIEEMLRELQRKPGEMLRIDRLAGKIAERTGKSKDDIQQEAYLLVLEGRRRWPKNIDLRIFFYGVMRSIASKKDRLVFIDPERLDGSSKSAWEREELDQNLHILLELFEQRTLPAIYAAIGNDLIVKKIVEGRCLGLGGKALEGFVGVKKELYDAAKRRLNRLKPKIGKAINGV